MCFIHYRLDIFYSLSLIGYLYQHGPCHTAIRLIRLYFLPACKFTIFFFISSSFVVFFIIFVQTIVKQTNGTLGAEQNGAWNQRHNHGLCNQPGGAMKPKPPKNFGVFTCKGGAWYIIFAEDSAGHLSILLQNISSIFPLLSEEHEKHSKKDKYQQHDKHQQHDKPMT